MIHLDTNYLIGAVTTRSLLEQRVLAWFKAGQLFSTSSIAWSEFLNGPVFPPQTQTALTIIERRIIPFGLREAEVAAMLFNRTGRRRSSRSDCFVAATAICARVPLATENKKDFLPFVTVGLQLA